MEVVVKIIWEEEEREQEEVDTRDQDTRDQDTRDQDTHAHTREEGKAQKNEKNKGEVKDKIFGGQAHRLCWQIKEEGSRCHILVCPWISQEIRI